jgi:Asp-tRNA(Asn)/Glu-tRNA(Gln) amidotransferase A subunit family amidase
MPVVRDAASLSTMVHQIATGELLPSEVVAAALERMDSVEPGIRAWVRIDGDAALRAARELDNTPDAGLLRGIPFGVKDIIDVQGVPTECGSPLRKGTVAEADAWLVDRLRHTGAIPLGKTVTTEFAYFAPGPTKNPHNPAHTPGGSSSGSAAAVAAGVVPLALGSQTAGSLTRPAAYCGVAGFVSAFGGPLATTGFGGLARSLDSAGLLTPSVADLRLVYLALTGADRLARPVEPPRRPRLAVWAANELGDVAHSMRSALQRATDDIASLGGTVEELGWSTRTPSLVDAHLTVMAFESARELAAEAEQPEHLSPQLTELLTRGRETSVDAYRRALSVAEQARAEILEVLTGVDAILGPAALGPAPEGLETTGSPVLSRPWQLLGLPVVTVPGYRENQGMPLGLQLIGHPHRVDHLFSLGHAIEQSARPT